MKAIDYRNVTWDQIQDSIVGWRLRVLTAWREFGPATTRELADRSGIDILTLRPRTTELLDMGFMELVDLEAAEDRVNMPVQDRMEVSEERRGQREGVYRARTPEAARHWLECQRHAPQQLDLTLRAEGGAPC